MGADEIQDHYSEWVLTNGFRDIIEGVSKFLESVHQVLSIWEITEKNQNGIKYTVGEWNDFHNSSEKTFHKFGLPTKFTHLENEHKIDFKNTIQMLSINKARNCLVHRQGIVKAIDTNNLNTLEVKWTKLMLVIQNEDGEKEFVVGYVIKKGNIIDRKLQKGKKTFSLGESITFTVGEFSNITWFLYLFGNEIINKVRKIGESKGFINNQKKTLIKLPI